MKHCKKLTSLLIAALLLAAAQLITWGSQPIEPIEAIMQAAGLR